MRTAGVITGKSEAQRNVSIGEKVRLYRECSNLPQTIFAERVGITLDTLQGIEAGMVLLNTKLLMKISEELKIGYSDLFEADKEQYYPNLKDKEIYSAIRKKIKDKKHNLSRLAEKMDTTSFNLSNWLNRSYIPSPFSFQNFCTLLEITSKDLCYTEPKVEPAKEVKDEPKKFALEEIMDAVNIINNIDGYVKQLNIIIEEATILRDKLQEWTLAK